MLIMTRRMRIMTEGSGRRREKKMRQIITVMGRRKKTVNWKKRRKGRWRLMNSYTSCPDHVSNKSNESCCDAAEKFFPLFGGGGIKGSKLPVLFLLT
jgi:hypothetical protein